LKYLPDLAIAELQGTGQCHESHERRDAASGSHLYLRNSTSKFTPSTDRTSIFRSLGASRKPARQATSGPRVKPELRELLDHLGRLLAKEYVKALAADASDKAAPRAEEGR
jgi:hypothetical protein